MHPSPPWERMESMTPSDASGDDLGPTLVAVARGDGDAFARLYRQTSARLFGICVRMLPQRSDAEDVLQDIYVTIWNRASTYDTTQPNPIGWLIAIARSKAIDRLRTHKRDRRNTPLDDTTPLVDETPSVADLAETSDDRRRLDSCLATLEDRQRAAIRQAFMDGSTHNELAERWAVPLGTMKSWIRRGLAQLKACLER